MNSFYVILLSLSIILLIPLSTNESFAAIPTEHNEWDFDFVDVHVYQDKTNLNSLIIKPNILFKGENAFGTVNIDVRIIQPDGTPTSANGRITNMESGETEPRRMHTGVIQEGKYKIHLSMTPPEKPYFGHVFDTFTTDFTIPKNGFENIADTVVGEEENSIMFSIENPQTVAPDEAIHAVINLPEIHNYEGIVIVNDEKIIHTYDTDTEEFYLTSDTLYRNMEIHLVENGNLFPKTYAQNSVQDYVTTYKVNKDMCSSLKCLDITVDDVEEEFQLMYLAIIVPVIVVVIFAIKFLGVFCKKKYGKPHTEIPPIGR